MKHTAKTLLEKVLHTIAYIYIFRLLEWIQNRGLKKKGYDYLTINHIYNFANPNKGCYIHTFERMLVHTMTLCGHGYIKKN